METSPFQRLSPELRNAIWELALVQPDPIKLWGDSLIYFRSELRRTRGTGEHAQPLALVRTCKQIHRECGHLFYIHNRFILLFNALPLASAKVAAWNLRSSESLLRSFISYVGPEKAALLADVTIHWGGLSPVDSELYSVVYALCILEQYAIHNPHWHLTVTLDLGSDTNPEGIQKRTVNLYTIASSLGEEATAIELSLVADEGQRVRNGENAAMLRTWAERLAEKRAR